jgi:flagellar assembly factor FliW
MDLSEPALRAPNAMAVVETSLFGPLEYEPEQRIALVAPLPGLPETRWLLPVSQQVMAPFVFFQSLDDADLCLLAAPARVVKADFELVLTANEQMVLRFAEGTDLAANPDVGVFAFVSVSSQQVATANLLAPLVVNLAQNLATQVIQPLDESFLRYPVQADVAGPPPC